MNFKSLFTVFFVTLCSTSQALCPDKCSCDNVNLIVTCVRAGLEVMPNTLNPRLQTIVYKYNNFPMVDVSLRFLSELVKVDLSHNHIVSVTNSAFASQTGLKTLRLDSNKIGIITNKTFVGLSRLEVLSFRNNEVSELPENLFIHAPKLQKVDLARNRIASVNEKTFVGLESLEILHLEDNFLSSIPTEAFRSIQTLAELYISGNPLLNLPANGFMPFRSLNILDLSSCQIRTIDDLAFRGLGTLRKLKIGDNNLTEVPAKAFRNIHGLKGFDIGRNPFDTIRTDDFRFLPKLKHLEISGCQHLTEIMAGAFSECTNLEYVIISMNRALIKIDPAAFDAVPSLRHINLSDNKLRNIGESLVPWRHLRSLDLSGNPWQCDCDLAFIPNVLRYLREKSDESSNATHPHPEDSFVPEFPVKLAQIVAGNCASPDSQHSVSLHDFKPNCSPPMRSSSNTGQEDLGDNHEDDVMRDTNAMAVIISISVVVVVLTLAITSFVCIKCRSRYRDWAKHHRLWRHQTDNTSPGISSLGSSGTKSSSLRRGPHYADHFYYPSPYRQSGGHSGNYSPYSAYYTHHQGQNSHHLSQNSAPLSASDDEYYYVSTSMRDNGAKHIPVTVL